MYFRPQITSTFLIGRTVLFLLPLISITMCFNIADEAHGIFSPTTPSANAYFGYSVGIVKDDEAYFLVVGAPRSNTSSNSNINEPGAMFKCDIRRADRHCEEVVVDETANNARIIAGNVYVHAMRDNAWNGAALDVSSEEYTVICAPRWKSRANLDFSFHMNGYCSVVDPKLESNRATNIYPLANKEKQTYLLPSGFTVYYYQFGQAGMSVHISPPDKEDLILGAPGILNWRGGAIRMRKSVPSRWEETTRHDKLKYTNPFVPNPFKTPIYGDFSSFGYSMTTGSFSVPHKGKKLMYVAGAPRSGDSHGQVFVYEMPRFIWHQLQILEQRRGLQLGEYFGAAVATPDLNGDDLSELAVGAPFHSIRGFPEMGCVYVFINNKEEGKLSQDPIKLEGDKKSMARFGSSLSHPGDLDSDGFEDLLVGAPYEEEEEDGSRSGAVYVFMGRQMGIRSKYTQKLTAKSVSKSIPLKGFGISFSRQRDVDGNHFPDVAIGSYDSGHVALMLTRPVIGLSGHVKAPAIVSRDETEFNITACLIYNGKSISSIEEISMHISLRQGGSEGETHVQFKETGAIDHRELITPAPEEEETCRIIPVEIKVDENADDPVNIQMMLDIPTSDKSPGPEVPMVNPYLDQQKSSTSVSFVSNCGDDNKCQSDLLTTIELKGFSLVSRILIGETMNVTLKVDVSNQNEPAYRPRLIITVPSSVDFLPWRSDCERKRLDSTISLTCQLNNPLTQNQPDFVEVDLDLSHLTETSAPLLIDAGASSVTIDTNPKDNNDTLEIKAKAKASIRTTGWSSPEDVIYDSLNHSTSIDISLQSSIAKSGITPISSVEVLLRFPEKYYAGGSWKTLLNTKNVQIVIDNKIHNCANEPVQITKDLSKAKEADEYPLSDINCTSKMIQCSEIVCNVGPWRRFSSLGTLTVQFSMNLADLDSIISIKEGAKLISVIETKIKSIHKDIDFNGNRNSKPSHIVTFLKPQSLAELAWWVYPSAGLGGLLLILLISFGLLKVGFFRRKKLESMRMQTQQANLIPAEENLTSN